MENLYLNVILKQKTNESPELFFKKDNTIESSKLKEPAKLGIFIFTKKKFLTKMNQLMTSSNQLRNF